MSLVCVSFDLVFGVGPLVLAHASRVAPGSAKSKDLRPKPVFTPNPFPLAGSRRSASNTAATILLSPPKSLSEGSLAPQQTDRHARRACARMARRARAGEIFVPIACPEVCATAPCLPRSALRSSLRALLPERLWEQ